MNRLLQAGLCAALVCALLGGTCVLCPEWTVARWREDWEEIARLQRVRKELDDQSAAVLRRIDAQQAVLDELIAGRLTLVEVAAHYRSLDQELPADRRAVTRRYFPGASEGECYCRRVIECVRIDFASRGLGPADAAIERLECELQETLDREGTVTLPAPGW